jgi:hypothetical protein
MRLNLRNLVLLSAALSSTAAFAANPTRVNVPFNFVAENHAYQAGSYIVQVDEQRSVMTLSNVNEPQHNMMWIIAAGETDPAHPKVSLTFDVTGQNHVLRTIQYGTLITPNLDKTPKQQVESTNVIGE